MTGKHNATLRPAEPRDAGEIALLAQALALHVDGRSLTREETLLRDAFSETPRCHFLVAEAAEEGIIGFLMHYPGYDLESAAPGQHLGDIFVLEHWRKRGIGKALIARLAEQTRAQGGTWISFTVVRKNKAARKFYQKLGAKSQGVEFMAIKA